MRCAKHICVCETGFYLPGGASWYHVRLGESRFHVQQDAFQVIRKVIAAESLNVRDSVIWEMEEVLDE